MITDVRLGLKAVLVFALSSGLPANVAGTATAQENQAPLVRTTTRLVQLNVVVLDKQNHPVTDLTKEDFRAFDNGVEQQIAHFTGAAVDAPSEPVTQSPLAINNRQNLGDTGHGVTAILMDELILDSKDMLRICTGSDPNDPCTAIRQMRLQVLEFLSKLPPGEVVGIYALRARGVVVIHDFSDDPASLAAAAKSLGGEGLRSSPADHLFSSTTRALVQWTQNASAHGMGLANKPSEDADRLIYGFQAVVKHLEGIPGRKNLVWVSSTLPMQASDFNIAQMAAASTASQPIDRDNLGTVGMFATEIYPDPRNNFEETRKFGRWLAESNIAIYPFDAYGLQAGDPEGPQAGDNRYSQWAAADLFAKESGGQALVGHNRLADDLQQIVSEGRQAYQMDYYPGDKDWDGKYHHIVLRLTPEHQGLTLLCRKGYYATDNPLSPSYENFREAARSPVEAQGIDLTLDVPSNPIEWGPETVVLKLSIQDLQFQQKQNLENANLGVAFVQLGKDGKILEGVLDNVKLALQPDTYADAEQQGWFYTKELVVSGMAAKLRVVVRDRATGATGTVSVPIHPFSMKNAK